MRDIPVFTSEFGVASLTLSQVPYKQEAYIRIQDSRNPDALLEECCRFCRMAGAENLYFTGFEGHSFPAYTELWKMVCSRIDLPDTDAALIPVQDTTLEMWRKIYNHRMKAVPLSVFMSVRDGKKLLKSGEGYFVHRGDELLGIGIASGETISAIASVVPGAGKDVLLALNHALSGESVEVEVASENARGIRLYESFGFYTTQVISKWYKIL